ncbi:hypothetical protein [Halocynthiibacter sp.]|uniref:hypothetical protein n=1 Tax=Halocynthiibacter sp. TaxID=1979210 RepID=UPI003C3CF7D1
MSGVRRNGDDVTVTLTADQAFTLRVALKPVRVGETTSTATQKFRDRLDKALARALGDNWKRGR